MSELEFQVVRAAGFVAAVGLVLGLQRFSPHRRVTGYRGVNIGLWGLNLVVMGGVCGACACTVAVWAARRDFGLLNIFEVPTWIAVLTSVVVLDFVSYCWHRANHVLPFLWRFHQVHHADPNFSASTGVRFHPGELLLSLPLRLSAVTLLGAPITGVIVFELTFGIANLFEHGDIDIRLRLEGILQRVLITPALHRRHHGRAVAQLGSNFGTVFSLWDRLFGTYGDSTSATQIEIGLEAIPTELPFRRVLELPLSPTRAPFR
jgi:sterol desaturase/sphingolipid hydroxylase (fatty acid hydroxylase superfamily)